MTSRLYTRYAGAPVDRPGGPWWYTDFRTTPDALAHFKRAYHPAIYAEVRLLEDWRCPNNRLPTHGNMDVCPPPEARGLIP
jgi:hypothetical protein